jgi:hypothetical protein
LPALNLHVLTEILSDGHLVDDASRMDIANALVAARLPDTLYVKSQIKQIIAGISSASVWSLYSHVWIASKYGSVDDLLEIIESKVSVWASHEQLSRLMAGLFPRFLGTSMLPKFRNILRRAAGAGALSVAGFHDEISNTKAGYTSIGGFIRAVNSSLPNRISHSKFLMLLSLLKNPSLAATAITQLKVIHSKALTDEFYKPLVY